ncbi:uncharacterized protein FTOL_13334 [Fusarium torulosum]|uniref:Uncharacterized protein n=1 Tax=Fusarium torulosum TaxID=33205 RepID=A0AAE8SPT7_9HYPO|nr:uncharacterized protein FTOL_13334 [Fusarium torulosum]
MAAQKVNNWKTASEILNFSMVKRFQEGMTLKRRPVKNTVNSIKQKDLENLSQHFSNEIPSIGLPPEFGVDKFGLMAHEQ